MKHIRVSRLLAAVSAVLLIGGCNEKSGEVKNYDALQQFVSKRMVGQNPDHWIEMKNFSGEWERIGLIFGYLDDFDECQKAIAGLKKVNYAREYRCVPANG